METITKTSNKTKTAIAIGIAVAIVGIIAFFALYRISPNYKVVPGYKLPGYKLPGYR
jgi:flagellar biosynthesis/type III secretory pathway M-ring protein FliF/YscJ